MPVYRISVEKGTTFGSMLSAVINTDDENRDDIFLAMVDPILVADPLAVISITKDNYMEPTTLYPPPE